MKKDQNASATRRIDLSNCKLLSVYGHSTEDMLKASPTKIGQPVKVGGIPKPGFGTR